MPRCTGCITSPAQTLPIRVVVVIETLHLGLYYFLQHVIGTSSSVGFSTLLTTMAPGMDGSQRKYDSQFPHFVVNKIEY